MSRAPKDTVEEAYTFAFNSFDRYMECAKKSKAITEILGAVKDQDSLSDASMTDAAWAASDFISEAREIHENLYAILRGAK